MSRFLRVPLTVLAMLMLSSLTASAQQADEMPANPAGYYPARFIEHAVNRYYRVFGEMPGDWASLVASGIYPHQLTGPEGQVVDPDDGQLDFPGDAYLQGSANFFTLVSENRDGSENRRILVQGETYVNQFKRIRLSRHLLPEHDARLKSYESNMDKLVQFAQVGLLNQAIQDYHGVFGMYPDTMEDLFSTGFTPINPDTPNPVTGVPYKFDGSPGDLRLNAAQQFSAVLHVDEDGMLSTTIEY
ncbi:MAG: hypothetical protein H7A35_08295 [Planctomycetales bacterium]|nr:hypothetical protein [bacterium]UNM06885.1 MAG: hypothetical protein H7A35_08295 [Planctomycetales bacterium]